MTGRHTSALAGAAIGALLVGFLLPSLIDAPDLADTAVADAGTHIGAGDAPGSPTDTAPDPSVSASAPGAPMSTASGRAADGAGAVDREAASPAGATATDPATNPTELPEVKLGFVLLDLGGSGRLGFDFGLDPEQQEAAIRASVDELNDRGGLSGRPIRPVFATFNVLDSFTSGGDSGRRACLALTEDEKVFAVVGYLFPADQLCVTHEHATPLLSDAANNLDSVFAASEGRLLSVYPRAGRIMTTFARFLHEARFLDGLKVGIVGELNADPQGEVAQALEREVTALGHPVVRVTQLSGDISQGASQMPVEVNQQRTAGAEVILFLTHPLYVQQFAQQAESQGWRPKYGFSDFANGTADPANDMPESLHGALGVSGAFPGAGTKDTAGWPEPAAASACRDNYERRTGRTLAARGSGDNSYSVTLVACDDLRILAALAARARTPLTRGSLLAAADQPLVVDDLGRIPGGSYGPGKRDLADFARLQTYDSKCQCFHPHGAFRRTP